MKSILIVLVSLLGIQISHAGTPTPLVIWHGMGYVMGENSADNPWPYLRSFFEFRSKKGNSLKFACVLCKPRNTEIAAYINSPSNLGKHVKAIHGVSQYEKYQNQTIHARKRKYSEGECSQSQSKQTKLTDSSFTRRPLQQTVDRSLVSLVTRGLLPFCIVELPEFIQFVHVLQPDVQILGRTALRNRIEKTAEKMRKTLIEVMGKVEYIATTTDCWSSRRRSFIGLTAHWIDPVSLERCSAALACRRLKGSHTYDVLASAIDDIHCAYKIRDKVTRTTTDNGSNFVKAFSTFSDGHEPNTTESNNDTENDDSDDETSDTADNDLQYTDASTILSSVTGLQYRLPAHQRCSCHLLHLVATKDIQKAEENAVYKKLSRSVFAKLVAVWNKVGRSVLAAETVERECDLQLLRPIQTRWNSLFLAVEQIINILKRERGEAGLRNVFMSLEVTMLTTVEQDFLKEYCYVMKPMATAIDLLQSEKNSYMGWLLPILQVLETKLDRYQDLNYCKPLALALIDGIHVRFDSMMKDPQMISAAILLPRFRTDWTPDVDVIQTGIQYIQRKLETAAATNISPSTTSSEDDEDFFASITSRSRSSNKPSELDSYLRSTSKDLGVLHSFPAIKELFLATNTPLPASAACERLFSSAGQIFRPNRASISSKNFENQLLLKLNHLYL